MEFGGRFIGDETDERQPGCSHWNDSLNGAAKESEHDNREGEMEFGVRFIGDEIELDLGAQNVHRTHESKWKSVSASQKQDQMGENDEQWSENEDDQENNSGVLDTMLTSRRAYILAPGQGRAPASVLKDEYSEELAYPDTYCGQNRPDNKLRKVPVYYGEICKSESRHQGQRVTQDPDNLFFKIKKMQMKMMLDKVQVAIRKCKCKDLSLKIGSLKDHVMRNDIVFKDIGYKFLNTSYHNETTRRNNPNWRLQCQNSPTRRWKYTKRNHGRIHWKHWPHPNFNKTPTWTLDERKHT